ncbi:UDP-N-acetylmuramoyl-L-alanyl-D-glutamate--2,6-diaminopimelate ligase [Trueperella sp. LYQ143]|uniref:UDP-N-acetylmuramoyl-L-alanyl-D-glutamate--2, 6-diaminopimelate ligase n=1 Tax=unclassified Trueperella TaxID=2630174 RepID=UPI003982F289
MGSKYDSGIRLSELARHLGTRHYGDDAVIRGVSADNRTITAGDLFIAGPGARVHAATFAQAAWQSGAVAICTDPAGALMIPADIPRVIVDRVPQRAGEIAAIVLGYPSADLHSFAVTGTNGKTTTTFMIDDILRALGRTTGLIGTVCVRIAGSDVPAALTTPQPVDLQKMLAQLRQHQGTDLVMEVSSHALAQGRTRPLCFTVAGFTNLTQDHLDFHQTFEEYFAAKAKLFEPSYCQRAVVTIDDEWGERLYRQAHAVRPDAITALSMTGKAAQWQVHHRHGRPYLTGPVVDEPMEIRTDLAGDFNEANAALALAMVLTSGVDPQLVRDIVSRRGISPVVPGRMEAVGQHPYTVVDFAHNTDALEKAMTAMRAQRPDGRLIVVSGSAGDRDKLKRPMMAQAISQCADMFIVTDDDPHGEDPAKIRSEVIAGIVPGAVWKEIPDRAQAIAAAIAYADDTDAILIAGRGHETIQDVAGTAVEIDDRVVARQCLAQRQQARESTS